ncbi:MAG: hypothetical protein ACUVQ8_01070 [Nitrososphaeria archaeon]
MEKGRLCPLCNSRLLLVEDELVCQSCGYVLQDDIQVSRLAREVSYSSGKLISSHELGSYVGPPKIDSGDNTFQGIGGGQLNIRYLKMVSDYGFRSSKNYEEYSCMRIISRISDKLELPEAVSLYALDLSRNFLDVRLKVKGISIPAVCLYSLMVSCKKFYINRVNTKKLIRIFKELGYRVSLSSIIRISIVVDVPLAPKPSEDYLLTMIPAVTSNPIVNEKIKRYYSSPVEYERKLYRTIISVLAYIEKYKKGGHNPYALAATSVYAGEIALSKIERRQPLFSQHIVSQSVDVAEYTIREQYGELFRDAVLSFLLQVNC